MFDFYQNYSLFNSEGGLTEKDARKILLGLFLVGVGIILLVGIVFLLASYFNLI